MQRRDPKSIKVHSSSPGNIQSMEWEEFEDKMSESQVLNQNSAIADEIDAHMQKKSQQLIEIYDPRKMGCTKFNEHSWEVNLQLTPFLEKDPSYQKIHVPNLNKLETSSFQFIQNLDVSSSSFGIAAVKTLCADFSFRNLKFLNLSENLLGNDGIMYLASNSHWTELQTLILQKVEIDYQGAKHLGMNESWKALIELDLSQNPLIGDLGAMSLSLNKSWTNLERLILGDCNIQALGIKCIERNKNLRGLVATNFMHTTNKDEKNQEIVLRKFGRNSAPAENKMMKEALRIGSHSNKSEKTFLVNHLHLRGGFPQESNDLPQATMNGLLIKLSKYEEKISNDKVFDHELRLYIDPRGTLHSHLENCHHYKINDPDGSESFDLEYDIRKHFLECTSENRTKVLLLTGKAGIGKSFFCKKFQRDLLFEWKTPSNQELDEKKWFPIYVELSSLKNPKSDVVAETLSRELSLTPEEITLLQNSGPRNDQLPNLLFIFDGFENIQGLEGFCALTNNHDSLRNNFCLLNKIEPTNWNNAKFIITCRDMYLRQIKRRDLLFAPLAGDSVETYAPIPGSFLQRRIEPFSDVEITCYLRKTFYFRLMDEIGMPDKTLDRSRSFMSLSQRLISSSSSPWDLARTIEKMIDYHKLRDIARIPFILWLMVDILPEIAAHGSENGDANQPENMSMRFLIESFVRKVITSILTQKLTDSESSVKPNSSDNSENDKLNHRTREIILQLQNFALTMSGIPRSKEIIQEASTSNYDASLLELYPLIQSDHTSGNIKFRCPLLIEFFVAQSIGEEIREVTTPSQDSDVKVSEEFLLNRKYLTRKELHNPIFYFLFEALKDKKYEAEQLVKLIKICTPAAQNQDKKKKAKEIDPQQKSSAAFAIAVTNAITLLNVSGYDFSHQDFSDICIPEANLSHGIFEGTKFTRANLQGVNFTGAWLKDANLVMTNMQDIEFGEPFDVEVWNKRFNHKVVFSPDGRYMATSGYGKTVIFEINWDQSASLQQIKRIDKEFARRVICPLSTNGDQIATTDGIEDIGTGETLKKIEGDREEKILQFSSDWKEIFASDDYYKIQNTKFLSDGRWSNCDFNLSCRHLFVVGHLTEGTRICNSTTGRMISRLRKPTDFCQFSYDGRQVAAKLRYGGIKVLDTVRGHIISSFLDYRYIRSYKSVNACTCSFTMDGRRVPPSQRRFINQDVVEATITRSQFKFGDSNSSESGLSPDGETIATYKKGMVSFKSISSLSNRSDHLMIPIRGSNDKGLSLVGTVANNSTGVSKKSIAILITKGDYGPFKSQMTKNLFNSTAKQSKKMEELIFDGKQLEAVHANILANDSSWVNLQTLKLSNNNIGDEGISALSKNKIWKSLLTLDLENTSISADGVAVLCSNITWSELRTLNLARNSVGDKGIANLSETKLWTQLEVLNLQSNSISAEGAVVLGSSKTWRNLDTLNLSNNPIGDRGATGLSNNRNWPKIKQLDLHDSLIRWQGAADLAKNTVWIKLLTLNLGNNWLGPEGATELAKNSSWKKLQTLNLENNYIGDRGSAGLCKNTTWTELQTLQLGFNSIGAEGVAELNKNKTWKKLETLGLGNNWIGNDGAMELSKNKTWKKLQTLDLKSNRIEGKGATELSKNKTWTNLQALDLSSNKIDEKVIPLLIESSNWASPELNVTLIVKEN